jgi:preprotein translocase subunit YajC
MRIREPHDRYFRPTSIPQAKISSFSLSGGLLVFLISDAHAAAPPSQASDAAGFLPPGVTQFLPLIVILAVFFLFMIRPQMKKQKEHNAMLAALAKGDEVVTSGGLLGKVTGLSESSIGLQIASGVEVQVQRSAVVQVLPKGTLKTKE